MNPGWTLHHVGVATSDAQREAASWAALGYVPVTGLIHDPVQRVRVLFLGNGVAGAPLIELVEPAAEDAPVTRFIGQAPRFYHICMEVPDLEGALASVRQQRWLIVQHPVVAAAYQKRRIAWCYTPNRDLVELLETTHVSDSPSTAS